MSMSKIKQVLSYALPTGATAMQRLREKEPLPVYRNPATKVGLSAEEKIIAYGVVYPSQTVKDMTELIIPLNYYDNSSGAPTGNYTIVISCATSRYGDT